MLGTLLPVLEFFVTDMLFIWYGYTGVKQLFVDWQNSFRKPSLKPLHAPNLGFLPVKTALPLVCPSSIPQTFCVFRSMLIG